MMKSSLRTLQTALLLGLVFGLIGPAYSFGQDFLQETKPRTLANPLIQLELKKPAAKKPAGTLVEATLKPVQGSVEDLKPGQMVTLSVTINVPKGSYTYSTASPKGQPTRFDLSKTNGLEAVDKDFKAEREPKTEFSAEFEGFVEKYDSPITWTRKYRLADGVALSDVAAVGKVRLQLCDENVCLLKSEPIQAALGTKPSANALVHQERPSLSRNPGPAELTVTLAPQDAKPGEKVTLTIQMAMDEGWHTYSITQKKAIGAAPTIIEIEELQNLKPLGEDFTPSEPFEKKTEDLGFATVEHEIHHGTIAWSRDYEVLPKAESEGFGIKGGLDYQTCKTSCVPSSIVFDLKSSDPAAIGRGHFPSETQANGGVADDSAPKDARAVRLAALLGEASSSTKSDPGVANSTDEAKNKGLLWFIVAAVVAGFGALLTPCVYPMVPITISFFLKQSEKQHHRPITLALVYCGGIIATFTGLGLLISALFEATDLNRLANNVGLNLMLTGVILFFGISMLGVFEIRVPSGLLTWSAGKEQKGGIIGTLFMALTFTLVSFTCTFAFAGGLLVMASKGEFFWPIVGMLAFSGAFAFPFFLLALFPKMLTKLPKSGGWMNIIKISMGFLEIGAALKFLSVADSIWFGQPTYLPYNVVMGAWFALALLAGLYPLGLYRMPHDTPGKFTLGRLAFAAPFLALSGMIGSALFTSYQPSGWVWDNIAAFAPPRFHGGGQDENEPQEDKGAVAELGPYLQHDNLTYSLDFLKALDYARRTNQPLFVDFTGQNCINCRKMELTVFPQPETRERLEKFVRVQVFVDQIPLIEDETEREWLTTMNRKLHLASGDLTMPIYMVLNPHDIAENGQLNRLSNFIGMEQNAGDFARFLDEGFEKFQTATASGSLETAVEIGKTHVRSAASLTSLQ